MEFVDYLQVLVYFHMEMQFGVLQIPTIQAPVHKK